MKILTHQNDWSRSALVEHESLKDVERLVPSLNWIQGSKLMVFRKCV